jgi:hypothetical protein
VNIPVVLSEGSDRYVELVYIIREYFQDVVSRLNYFSLFLMHMQLLWNFS